MLRGNLLKGIRELLLLEQSCLNFQFYRYRPLLDIRIKLNL